MPLMYYTIRKIIPLKLMPRPKSTVITLSKGMLKTLSYSLYYYHNQQAMSWLDFGYCKQWWTF